MLPELLRLESGFVDTARFGLARNLRPAEVDRLCCGRPRRSSARRLRLPRRDAGGSAASILVETLKAYHETKPPTRPACSPSGCALALKKRWPPPVFQALLDREMRGQGRSMVDGTVPAPARPLALKLGARDEALWKKISADLMRERFKPPRVRDFAQTYGAPEADVRKLLQRLARLGRVVEVAPDQYFLRPGGGRDDRHRARPSADDVHRRRSSATSSTTAARWRS